jgi:hypothetical protein
MDREPADGVNRAWAAEIHRRAERAVDGVSEGEDWEAVYEHLSAELRGGRRDAGPRRDA